jgi:putative tryptophan/tyrosine transport system substrate-binding protein
MRAIAKYSFGVCVLMVILLTGCAQKAPEKKVYHVGVLSGLNILASTVDGFKTGMTEKGYVEGENIFYDVRQTEDMTAYDAILKKFIDDKVDLIVTFPTEPALAAKAATKGTGIPVVFIHAFIEDNGLIESLRQPGGDLTGVRYPGSEYTVKRLEMLHEMAPEAKRIWMAYGSDIATKPTMMNALRQSASALNLTLVEVPVTRPDEIISDLQNRSGSGDIGLDAILLIPDYIGATVLPVINEFAANNNIPIGGLILIPGMDILFGYANDNVESGKLAAIIADKIFSGIPAGTIPVVSPEAHLEIDYNNSQELGLTVPEGLLARADRIVR